MTKKSHKKKAAARRKKILLTSATVVAIAALAGGVWWVFMTTQTPPSQPKDEFSRERQLDTIAQTADQKAQTDGVDEGAKVYDQAMSDTSDQKEKSELMASKASLYYNEGRLDIALKYALEADALYDSSEVSALVAQLYEEKGDKKKAVEYYKKAAKLVDVKQPLGPSDKKYYDGKVKELGGSQ